MTALAPSNAHLETHRRLIVLRALAAGAVGMVPLPYLDEALAALIRRGTLKRLAETHEVDLDGAALDHLVTALPPPPPRGFARRVLGAVVPRLIARSLRKTFILVSATDRADESLDTFAAATLFDHYCSRLHVGAGIDLVRARQLRTAIDAAVAQTRSRVVRTLFRRGLATLGRALARLPLQVIEHAARGLRSSLAATPITDGTDVTIEAEDVTESTLAAAERAGLLGRVSGVVSASIGTLGATYLDELVRGFETRWREVAHP